MSKVVALTLTLDVTDPATGLHNDDKLVKQVLARLKRGPSASDGHGYIYLYKEQGKVNGYRKIGRTERLPGRRIEEWPGAVLVESWRCRRNRHAEVLIHWLLDGMRVYRYVMATDKAGLETLLSKWKRTAKFIEDPVYKARVKAGASLVTNDKPKHMEWFMGNPATMIKVIKSVVRDLNEHWKAEPWSAEMELMK